MVSAIAIQDALVERLMPLNERSLDRSQYTDGGVDSRPNVRAIHWIQYEGSDYDEPLDKGAGYGYQAKREMRFVAYVRVQDFHDNYQIALETHELIMARLAGFVPPIAGVESPLVLDLDDLQQGEGSQGTKVNQYRSRYRVRVLVDSDGLDDDEKFTARMVRVGLWRSPIDQLANPLTSTKDADLEFDLEEETIGS